MKKKALTTPGCQNYFYLTFKLRAFVAAAVAQLMNTSFGTKHLRGCGFSSFWMLAFFSSSSFLSLLTT